MGWVPSRGQAQTGDLLLAFLGPWHTSSPHLPAIVGSGKEPWGVEGTVGVKGLWLRSTQAGVLGSQEKDSAGLRDLVPLPTHWKDPSEGWESPLLLSPGHPSLGARAPNGWLPPQG